MAPNAIAGAKALTGEVSQLDPGGQKLLVGLGTIAVIGFLIYKFQELGLREPQIRRTKSLKGINGRERVRVEACEKDNPSECRVIECEPGPRGQLVCPTPSTSPGQ